MSRRSAESARLWFLVALFFIMVGLIGWSFGNALHDINAQTAHIINSEVPSARH